MSGPPAVKPMAVRISRRGRFAARMPLPAGDAGIPCNSKTYAPSSPPTSTAVDAEIRRQLAATSRSSTRSATTSSTSGGKRLRPLLVVLAARAAGARDSAHIPAAALIEFIHTATLLHDDVVDDSARRRGRATANQAFGNPASVLVGDFLYSRAFQMMAALDSADVDPRDGRRDEHDRCRRSAATDELRRPGHDRDPLHGGHLPQDRPALRGGSPDRRHRRPRAGRG